MNNRLAIFSGSTLKLIACVLMAIDHIGLFLFPGVVSLRAIGRLAFPIFAFFIAEGCKYTKNKLKHFALIFGVGIFYFIFYYIFFNTVYASVFLTFSVSILLIYLCDLIKARCFLRPCKWYIAVGACFIFVAALSCAYFMFSLIDFDYGFFGMLAPVAANLFIIPDKNSGRVADILSSLPVRILLLSLMLIPVCIDNRHGNLDIFGFLLPVQYLCYLAIPLLFAYNGKVGNKRLKYFFYLFYPLHLVIIEGIFMLTELLG